MNDLVLEADELLNEAIMSETPILIVEGIDDIQVYEEIADSLNKSVEVYAAENIKNVSEGCRGVIGCIEKIRECSQGEDIEPYILGLIDRDSRYFRNEIPEDNALLMLKCYSMESHFITEKATELVIKHLTRVSGKLLDENLVDRVHSTIQEHLFNLYLISLDALKNACEEDYDSIIGYGQDLGEIRGRTLDVLLLEREEALNEFASDLGIVKSWDYLLQVCKGKWLLSDYCKLLKEHVSALKEDCRHGSISQCQFCLNQTFEKCLYKIQNNFNDNQIKGLLLSNSSVGNFDYVKDRMEAMV